VAVVATVLVVMVAGALVVLVATDHRGAKVDRDAMLPVVVALLVVVAVVLVVWSTMDHATMATSG
jgi:hypothetical protein